MTKKRNKPPSRETSVKHIHLDEEFLKDLQKEFDMLVEYLHEGKHLAHFEQAIAYSLPRQSRLVRILDYGKDQLGGLVIPNKIILTFDLENNYCKIPSCNNLGKERLFENGKIILCKECYQIFEKINM